MANWNAGAIKANTYRADGTKKTIDIFTYASAGSLVHYMSPSASTKENIGIVRIGEWSGEMTECLVAALESGLCIPDSVNELYIIKDFRDDDAESSTWNVIIDNLREKAGENTCVIWDAFGEHDAVVPKSALKCMFESDKNMQTKRGMTFLAWNPQWMEEHMRAVLEQSDAPEDLIKHIVEDVLVQVLWIGFYIHAKSARKGCDIAQDTLNMLSCGKQHFDFRFPDDIEDIVLNPNPNPTSMFYRHTEDTITAALVAVLNEDKDSPYMQLIRCVDEVTRIGRTMEDMLEIWSHVIQSARIPAMFRYGILIDEDELEYDISTTWKIGEALGIDSMMETYFRGVPLEDILA